MENGAKKMKTLKTILIIIIIISLFAISRTLIQKSKIDYVELPTEVINNITQNNVIHMCYYSSVKPEGGSGYVAWLKLNLTPPSEKISGEFNYLPAEKDSKVGTFEGIVGPVNKQTMSRTADVWWNSLAEGIHVTEELMISFGDGSASVGFGGEQKDRGDGVYVYTDKSKITYQLPMDQVDCESLEERLVIEKYVRENIKTIASNTPILGGNWYILSVYVNTLLRSGNITYEDGHIQSKATFKYTYEKDSQKITITKFEVIK